MDDEGYFLVLATASGRELAWVAGADQSEVVRGTRLEPTAWADLPEAGTQVPTAWRILSPQGRLAGELDVEAADRIPITADGAAALGYVLVTGWVEDRGARREVFGLVRHVR
ncbi:MAG: hypothetical protein GWN02_23650 [Gemmatimonadetes bacterium]|nr:hypothetical protein [Gemmatimonadota bacterium]